VNEIILDLSLPSVKNWPPDRKSFLISATGSDWEDRNILRTSIPETTYLHRGMYEYFLRAYNMHQGVVLDPAQVWYVILCEVAKHVSCNSEKFRGLFTTSRSKETIRVFGDAGREINPLQFLNQLIEKVPTNTDLFLPQFSTSHPMSDMATAAAFCDLCSPYYNYMMKMCGLPKIKILGTVEDWDKILACLDGLKAILDLGFYVDRIASHVTRMRDAASGLPGDPAYWKDIFHTKRCGSGGDVSLLGWLADFALKPRRGDYPENYPHSISKIEVVQAETGEKFNFYAGLFHSIEEDGYLIPQFGFIHEKV
jgi:hypothetical protein